MRIALLGLGFMGTTHLKALQSIPGVELAAVCSRDEKKLAGDLSGVQGNIGGAGERVDFSGIARCRVFRQVFEDKNVEAVDICLPTYLHAPVALEALASGKHVLVEKPMALDAASGRQMIAAAKEHGRVLMTAHVLRFLPAYRALFDLLVSGRLGAVRSAMFRRRCAAPAWGAWLSDPAKSGGGVFDLLIHDVDMCRQLFGKPVSAAATGFEALARGVDVITAQFHYPTRLAVTISGGWHHPRSFPFSMEYTVVAEGGTVEYDSATGPPLLYHADGQIEQLGAPDQDGYRSEIEYFFDCCRRGASPELCRPEESADAVALARLMLEARDRNGEKVRCNL